MILEYSKSSKLYKDKWPISDTSENKIVIMTTQLLRDYTIFNFIVKIDYPTTLISSGTTTVPDITIVILMTLHEFQKNYTHFYLDLHKWLSNLVYILS